MQSNLSNNSHPSVMRDWAGKLIFIPQTNDAFAFWEGFSHQITASPLCAEREQFSRARHLLAESAPGGNLHEGASTLWRGDQAAFFARQAKRLQAATASREAI